MRNKIGRNNGEIALDQWSHYTVLYDDSDGEYRFYVDGTRVDSTPFNIGETPSVSTDARVGSRDQNGENFGFPGTVVDARIYDRKLPKSEIQSIYKLGNSGDSLRRAIENYESN